MKRIFAIAIALIAVMGVNAQSLSVDNLNIAAGESGVAVINFEAPVDCKALQMTISLPEGIEIPYDEDEEEWGIEQGSLLKKYSVDINKTENDYKFLVYKNVKEPKFQDKSGDLLSITLNVAAGVADGVYNIAIKNIVVNDLESKPVAGFEDITFAVGVGVDVTTGINSLNADDSNEPAYNLAGQKVGKNYKGIVVKNGKKTLVK